MFYYTYMDGVEGFEPPNNGTKNRCLTAWPYPNRLLLISFVPYINKKMISCNFIKKILKIGCGKRI